jgi:pimeloyl-ACP methyl ester carboxylesterase
MSDVAVALADLVDGLRLRQVDVLGYHAGSLAAIELALARPQQVRRVVLMGVPLLDAREREAFLSRQPAGGAARELAGAVTAYAAGERLPLLRQPVLVLRPRDELRDATQRSDALLRDARRVDLESGADGLDAKLAADTLLYARDFLDR